MRGIHLLFDGNGTAYRANVVTELSTKQGFRTSAIMGTLNILHATIEAAIKEYKIPVKEAIFAWDKGHSKRRTTLYPEYKCGRKQNWTPEDEQWMEDFYAQTKVLHQKLPLLGVKSYFHQGWEGDDLIWGFVNAITHKYPDDLILIISSDEDFHQLIDSNVHIYTPVKKTFITPENYQEIKGIKLESFMSYKILQGDSSDSIPGIPGIGEKTAKSLVNKYSTIDNLLEHKDELNSSKRTARILTKEGLQILHRNVQLIDLKEYVDLTPIMPDIKEIISVSSKVSSKEAKQFLMEYQLASILVKFKEWIVLFEDIETGYFEEIL